MDVPSPRRSPRARRRRRSPRRDGATHRRPGWRSTRRRRRCRSRGPPPRRLPRRRTSRRVPGSPALPRRVGKGGLLGVRRRKAVGVFSEGAAGARRAGPPSVCLDAADHGQASHARARTAITSSAIAPAGRSPSSVTRRERAEATCADRRRNAARAGSCVRAASSRGRVASSSRPCAYRAVADTARRRGRRGFFLDARVEHRVRARFDPRREQLRRDVEPKTIVGCRVSSVQSRSCSGTSDAPASASSRARTTRRRSFACTAAAASGSSAAAARARGRRRACRSITPPSVRVHPVRAAVEAAGRSAPRADRAPCRRRRPASCPPRGSRSTAACARSAYSATDASCAGGRSRRAASVPVVAP